MKLKFFLLLLLLQSSFGLLAQSNEHPYAIFGYEGKVLKTPQERQHLMLLIPNTDTTSNLALIGIEPSQSKYYFFDKNNKLIYKDTLTKEQIARFLSVDPLAPDYPGLTPFQFASNRPIDGVDLDGLEYYFATDGKFIGNISGNKSSMYVRVITASEAEKYSNNVNTIHKKVKSGDIPRRNLPVYRSYKAPTAMKINEFLDLAHVAYGEGGGNQVNEFAHALWNREIKMVQEIDYFKTQPKGLDQTTGKPIYSDKTNSIYLYGYEKYDGVFGFSIASLHGSGLNKKGKATMEKQFNVIKKGGIAEESGSVNQNYSRFYKFKKSNDIDGLLGIKGSNMQNIFKATIQARGGLSTDPNPENDSWKASTFPNNNFATENTGRSSEIPPPNLNDREKKGLKWIK